ncbi:hypothetical protein [Hymenobacter mucosus]|uniref:Uncharacterized protein n=1 Tax=Hymenobacter mucosus TaxID=1411120 RepID=A0A238W0V5_9BACT|nr:hypothetical protein [Hymenobacter mucosus]SNR40190.1 hypothetical protein SAMN06269173_102125 [Hymenobacter mucosus]
MISSFPHYFLRFWGLLVVWLGCVGMVRAQQPNQPPNTRRCVWVRLPAGRDTVDFTLRDTLTIVPASVSHEGRALSYNARTNQYRYVRPATRFPSPEPGQPDLLLTSGPDSVLVCYRVLPVQLSAARYLRARTQMDSLDFRQRVFGTEDFAVKEQILSTPGINKTGNLSRGVSFGNAQNVFVNSSLNLQLEGRLTDQITLTAAISDQNVPFQPEGNTQQLQEFDRIYITLTHPRWSLTAGDVVLRNKPDYFLKFYKNIQGAALEANFGKLPTGGFGGGAIGPGISNSQLLPYSLASGTSTGTFATSPPTVPTPPGVGGQAGTTPEERSQTVTTAGAATGAPRPATPGPGVRGLLSGPTFATTTAAAGVAKGKFASIEVTPLENVQGPYRLRGPNGEQFIIVLANSERVYLDGRLMVRGFNYDYTIDYNQAEVTFSPQHLITRNSRIRIDFEYSDFNYARSLFQASHYQQIGRLQVHANFYREADNPDNSPNLTLTDDDKALLRTIGDNVSRAVTDGATVAEYDRRQVQYNREERTVNGQLVELFTYPPDSLRQVYTVRFTEVGVNQGSYVLSTLNANANGRVYDFVGAGLGNYAPVRVLPTPIQKQLVTVGANYQLDANTSVFLDLASSNLDLNRFSAESAEGRAMRVGYTVQDRAINLPGLRQYKLRSTLDYEYTSHRFAPIDRYRDIEFDRNWSTSSTPTNVTAAQAREDNILNFAVGAVKDANNSLGYRVSRRYRAGEVSGLQHWVDVAHQTGNVQLRGSLFLLNSEVGRRHSSWARGEATGRYVGGPVVPGYAYRFDKNRVALPSGDSLTSANYFDEHALFVQSRDSARTRFRVDYTYRRDQTPTTDLRDLQERGRAQTWQGTLATHIGRNQDLAILATYRDLSARDSARQRTVLSKIDWNATLFQNMVRSELSYAVATGRELRRDYSFLVVPNGQGTHYYGGDANRNGRQDKEEFFEAQTVDAQYRTHIKVYLPTDEYILAFTNRFSYRLTTNAPRGWRELPGVRGFVGRFSAVSTITLDRKTTDKSLSSRLNPFAFQTNDPQLLSLNKLLRNTLYFNRSNPIFGSEFTVQQAQQKVLLSQGSDTRNVASQSLLLRRTLAQSFTGRLTLTRSIRQNITDYLDTLYTRNFRLLQYEVAPEISYQPTQALRLTGTYLRTSKQNTQEGEYLNIRGTFDELGLETRLSQVGKRTLSATTRYVRVVFDGDAGDESSLVGLEILNALRPGSNFTWNLNMEQRLSNGLNITLAYDGRKANGLSVVHTGRMQVSVLF